MIFTFTDGTEYTVENDSDFKHMIGYYLENDLVFLKKENIQNIQNIQNNISCIDELNISNIAKNHIQNIFDECIANNIKTITVYDIKRYCSNNKIQYQSIYVLFRRIFGTDFIINLNDLYKKYANL